MVIKLKQKNKMNKVENANFTTYFLFFTIPLLFSTILVAKMDSLWKPSGEPSDIMFWEDSFKGTRVFPKTVLVCHIYWNFKIGFTCRITVIFGTLKEGSLSINTLASNICFSYRNMFQNGVDALSKIVHAFLSKSLKFYLVRIIR